MTRSCIAALVLAASAAMLGRPYPASALEPSESDPRVILRVALNPEGGESALSRVKMTIRDHGEVRERVMTMRSKRYPDSRKSLVSIEQPADVRNTGFLSVDYSKREKADEQWLYLPKLHKVSRVPSSRKADAFVGSDFTFGDLTKQDPDDFDLKLVEASTKVGTEECWLIEGVPHSEEVRRATGYSKVQTWVSKSKLVPVQAKMTLLDSTLNKYLKASDFRKTDGVWIPYKVQMRTVRNGDPLSETVIDVLAVKNGAEDVTDADFTQQRLESGV